MKLIYLLLLFSSFLKGFSFNKIPALKQDNPRIQEFVGFYKNGNLKYKTIILYDSQGIEEKTISEVYNKDGKKRYSSISDKGQLLQYAKYGKNGLLKFERTYTYDYYGNLITIDTRRADGERYTRNYEVDAYGKPYE